MKNNICVSIDVHVNDPVDVLTPRAQLTWSKETRLKFMKHFDKQERALIMNRMMHNGHVGLYELTMALEGELEDMPPLLGCEYDEARRVAERRLEKGK